MTEYINYDDVVAQLQDIGMLPQLPLEFNKRVRCRMKDRGGNQGWYHLHDDLQVDNKAVPGPKVILITGAYGYFQNGEKYIYKVTFNKDDLPKLTPEQRAENKQRQAEAAKQSKFELKSNNQKQALRAQRLWPKLLRTGNVDYVIKKLLNINGQDVRFTPSNALAIPIHDEKNYIWGLHFILDKTNHKAKIERRGDNKTNWPPGMALKGNFHHIGPMITSVALLCEGWATGMSLFMATGLPVICVFSTFNYQHVLKKLVPYYKTANFLLCGDDDNFYTCLKCSEKIQLITIDDTCPHCNQPHGRRNAGKLAVTTAAMSSRVAWTLPPWPEGIDLFEQYKKHKRKNSDFNDFHYLVGLAPLREHIFTEFKKNNWLTGITTAATVPNEPASDDPASNNLKITSVVEALERIWFIYGTVTVFDNKIKKIYKVEAFKQACSSREIFDQWKSSQLQKVILPENIGNDPTGKNPRIIANLYPGWPTIPKQGDCDLIIQLIEFLCSGEFDLDEIDPDKPDENKATELFKFVINWFAYPIQNPGSKMQTCLDFHGPQGTGKGLLAEAMLLIYGPLGGIINQRALESPFNDSLTIKHILFANEIATGTTKYDVKNIIKTLITDKQIWINPKGAPAYFEDNHCNLVFLSNEKTPLVLEYDDRRNCVVWTPPPLPEDFYAKVYHQIHNGGADAFHYYLLNKDLGDFNEHTKPPLTRAKTDLINRAKAPLQRMFDEWSFARDKTGEFKGTEDNEDKTGVRCVPFVPVQEDFFWQLADHWCVLNGYKPPKKHQAWDFICTLPGAERKKKRISQQIRTNTDPTKDPRRVFVILPGMLEYPYIDPSDDVVKRQKEYYDDCIKRFEAGLKAFKDEKS